MHFTFIPFKKIKTLALKNLITQKMTSNNAQMQTYVNKLFAN